MSTLLPLDYYNRHNPAKQYSEHLFRAGTGLQSAELNEVQHNLFGRLRGLADNLFKDGSILQGVSPVLEENGTLRLFESTLYIWGAAWVVPPAVITVPMSGEVIVGAIYKQTVITELEDPELRDPATGTRNYDEPGAARLKVEVVWGLSTDDIEGDFFPVHTVKDGSLLQNSPPPELDSVLQLVARYDRNSNGHYVIDGLTTRYLGEESGAQVFSVSEGECHVDGFEVNKVTATRLAIPLEPDVDTIIGEPHTFNNSGDGTATITMNKGPIAAVQAVRVTKRTTTTITHGAFTGVTDPLPDESILQIVTVSQGATNYTQGTSWLFTGDELDWSPGGTEPAPGSTYQVTYDHIVTIAPLEVTATTVKIGTALSGTVAYFDYTWKLPRIDRVVVDRRGVLSLVKGQPSKYNPKPADVPRELLPLALVVQNWSTAPTVKNNGVKVTPMSELEAMKNDIASLYDLVAQEQLKNNANASSPSAKKGIFVDPFFDDDMRDQGVAQTAAIVNGELMLAIDVQVGDVSAAMARAETLAVTYEVILAQTKGTGEMKINPYMAFDPVPAKVTLTQPVDYFTEVNTVWKSPVTQTMWVFANPSTTTDVQEVSRSVAEGEFLRQQTIAVRVEGFGPNEVVSSITFDGINVTPA